MMDVEFDKNIVTNSPMSTSAYYKDLRKFEPLEADEQVRLAVLARGGDIAAQRRLVNSNQRFVVTMAVEYLGQGLSALDLVNEGSIGMIKAIKKFDETRGIKFLSYAVWWIRQQMIQSCYENGETVRLPVNRINAYNQVSKIRDQLTQTLEREPTLDEICDHAEDNCLNLKRNDVFGTLNGNQSLSLETRVSEHSDISLIDMIESDNHNEIEEGLNKESLIMEINKAMSTFSQRETKIMNMYFGLNGNESMTLKDIGEEMSLTNERVRQIKEIVIKKLRSHSKSSRLREFLNVKAR